MNTSAPVTATIRIAAAPDEVFLYLVACPHQAGWISHLAALVPAAARAARRAARRTV